MKKPLLIAAAVAVALAALVATAFLATSGLASAAERFFEDIRGGDLDAAHARLSDGFRASDDRDALRRFVERNALADVTDISWTERAVHDSRGRLTGTATTVDGRSIPIQLRLLREAGDWRVHALQLAEDVTGDVSDPRRQALVRRSMADFAVSVNAASMAHFHGSVSTLWQRQASIADLDDAFGAIYGRGVDFGVLVPMLPVLGPAQRVDEDGVLTVDGWYDVPPNRVHFEQRYVPEGLDWRLLSFGYEVK